MFNEFNSESLCILLDQNEKKPNLNGNNSKQF